SNTAAGGPGNSNAAAGGPGNSNAAAGGPGKSNTAAALPRPGPAEVISGLPMPQVDRTSPAAGFLATFAGLDPVQRAAALTRAVAGDGVPPEVATSPETRLALVRALLDSGDAEAAGGVLADLAAQDPLDWRIAWYDGLRRLATGENAAAGGAF